jgi:hypothetical protein
MGAGILATNASPTAERLRAIRAAIDGWLELLEADEVDPGVLRARLDEAAARARDAGPVDPADRADPPPTGPGR